MILRKFSKKIINYFASVHKLFPGSMQNSLEMLYKRVIPKYFEFQWQKWTEFRSTTQLSTTNQWFSLDGTQNKQLIHSFLIFYLNHFHNRRPKLYMHRWISVVPVNIKQNDTKEKINNYDRVTQQIEGTAALSRCIVQAKLCPGSVIIRSDEHTEYNVGSTCNAGTAR